MAADRQIDILATPMGNIGCDTWAADGIATCDVKSYFDEINYPKDTGIGPSWIFALDDDVSTVEIAPRGDAMFFMMCRQEGNLPQMLEYGISSQYASNKWRSEILALICTDMTTSRGITM